MLSATRLKNLENEFGILHLLYHRNHNQHRVAVWWRYLDMVRRGIRKILRRIYDIQEAKKIKVRENLHKEAVQIASHLLTKVFPKAFYEFNGIIALGQFINLGLALVGSLSSLHSQLSEIEGVQEFVKKKGAAVKEVAADIDENDVGVEIETIQVQAPPVDVFAMEKAKPEKHSIDINSIFGEPKKKKKKTEKEGKKRKEKKKKSAMDDIFG